MTKKDIQKAIISGLFIALPVLLFFAYNGWATDSRIEKYLETTTSTTDVKLCYVTIESFTRPLPGDWSYSGHVWYDEDGVVVGYAETEDGDIYPHQVCLDETYRETHG